MMLSIQMRRVALAAHALLIVLVLVPKFSALGTLLALILLIPLPGLIRGRTYTYAWASMLVAFYVAGYLAEGYARPDTRAASFAIGSVAALDYIALMLFVRFTAREKAAHAMPVPAAQTASSDDASP